MGKREDLYVCTVQVQLGNTVVNLGVFDTFSGGEVDSEDTKYARGGLADEESLGGRRHVGNVTVGRLYDEMMQLQEPWLDSAVGRGIGTVTKQPLDEAGNAFGRPRVYTGKLLTMTPPDHDSESSDAARIELVFSTNGSIG